MIVDGYIQMLLVWSNQVQSWDLYWSNSWIAFGSKLCGENLERFSPKIIRVSTINKEHSTNSRIFWMIFPSPSGNSWVNLWERPQPIPFEPSAAKKGCTGPERFHLRFHHPSIVQSQATQESSQSSPKCQIHVCKTLRCEKMSIWIHNPEITWYNHGITMV